MTRKFDWITKYLEYSQHSEAPDAFHFWTGVSVIAGALRRRVWIDMGYFQWTPNCYIIFVAPPGIVSKTTTANIGMRLLKQIETIRFGPDAITWQALTQSLAASTEEFIDTHGEVHVMSPLTIVSGEFGTFMNPSDREMVDVMVSLWDGQLGTWEKPTKTQGSDIITNPWINLLACTTPDWIAGNFPEYMIGGGFTSRCIFVYADSKRQLVAYPSKNFTQEIRNTEKELVRDLETISQLSGAYTLAPDALAWGEEWYENHYKEIHGQPTDKTFSGYQARKQTHIHKLALILSASEHDEPIIYKETLLRAEAIITQLEKEMPKVFDLIGRSDDAQIADQVYRTVQRHGTIEKTLLMRELFNRFGLAEVDKGLQAALQAGLVSIGFKGNQCLIADKAKSTPVPTKPPLDIAQNG